MLAQSDAMARMLAASLADSTDVETIVDRLVSFAAHSLGTGYGGITLLKAHGAFETVGATDPLVVQADQLQYGFGEGPCVEASTQSRGFISSDLAIDPRWPRWGPAVSELGFHRVISAEMHARGRRIGAINLYGDARAQFTTEDLDTAQLFAYQGSLALSFARSEQGLKQAIDSRTVIGQAQGILMERYDIGAEQAFALLRRISQHRNIRLRTIAEGIATKQLTADVADVAQ